MSLSNTKATAILVECCFVDNKTDQAAWNVTKCAQAIVKGVTGKTVSAPSKPSESTQKPAAKPATKKSLGNVDACYAVYAGGKWWPEVKINSTGREKRTEFPAGIWESGLQKDLSKAASTRKRVEGFRGSRLRANTIQKIWSMVSLVTDRTSLRCSCIT